MLSGAAPARALSCIEVAWWRGPYEGHWPTSQPSAPVPVDARLWQFSGCYDEPMSCRFVSAAQAVEVDAVPVSECTSRSSKGYIVELVPREPLLPGQTYASDCGPQPPTFTTREGEASAPEPVVVREVGLDRRGDGACGSGDTLDLVLDGLGAPYLREGGRIELAYPDGSVIPVTEALLDNPDGLPETDGPIALTPVAIDGTRGETVRVDKVRYNQAVYVACAVGEPSPDQALWSLLPIGWVFVARRWRRAR